MTDNKVNLIIDRLDENPDLLEQLVKSGEEESVPTRGMPSQAPSASNFVRQILGDANISEQELAQIQAQLADNKVVQLYEAADGAIDAKELLSYVGGLNGTKGANSYSAPVRALFDGRLDLKEILIIIMLLKLFKKKQQTSYSNYYGNSGLFGSLFGNQQQTYNGGLFSNLLGNNSYSNTYSNPYGMFGSLFGNTYSQPTGWSSLFGGNVGQSSNNSLLNSLTNFVNGNYNNNPQSLQLYNLLNGASQNSFNTNGTINVGSLFNLLGTMMGR